VACARTVDHVRYVLVHPHSFAGRDGITTYLEHLDAFLRRQGIETVYVRNDGRMPRSPYQEAVRDLICSRFRPADVVIEAPEVGCATLLLPPEYVVHVRLHGSSAIVRRHNRQPPRPENFSEELRVARQARVVSSPSYALLEELAPHLDPASVHVYKNPPPPPRSWSCAVERRYDVAYLGNFSRLKGADYLNLLLTRLPAHYAVALAGRGSDGFRVTPNARCQVTVSPHIPGPERLDLLAQARVALSLSRFENCSMTVLECIAVGTVVAGWRVGGHAEIAGPPVLRLVPLGDVDALAAAIRAAVEDGYPGSAEFRAVRDRVAEDFHRGWCHVWDIARGASGLGIYRGLGQTAVAMPAGTPAASPSAT
jgi:glycosyltransferase involved in cell wall biosynthesis